MNVRKNNDYSEMYEAIDKLMTQQLPQMKRYCEIGKAVCRRTEKGAAVMASEYLNKQYPDAKGFSPRSLRRMRAFYRTYENHPALLRRALRLGWIQNVVIMEADLTMELREWYIKAVKQFGWSKTELIANISARIHESLTLAEDVDAQDTSIKNKAERHDWDDLLMPHKVSLHMTIGIRCKWWLRKDGRRRCPLWQVCEKACDS